MSAVIQLVTLLRLALACDGSASHMERLKYDLSDSDFYVLVQQWLPEACASAGITSSACVSPRSLWKQNLVLNGLQKHGPCHTVYEACNDTVLPVEDLPKATQSSLAEYWPGSWATAWQRYGTCIGLAPPDFFTEALRMHQVIVTPKLLQLAVGRRVNASDVLAAYGGVGAAVLQCHTGSSLSAVYTCWSGSPLEHVDCPLTLQDSWSCGPEIHVRAFEVEEPGQSQFATAIWLVQYTVLLCTFFSSWRADCRTQSPPIERSTCRACWPRCAFTRRTPIQFLAMVHAGVGVVSELWAINSDAAGETDLAMWPLLSLLELASNLAISVLMLFWYNFVCSSLGCAARRCAYYVAFFWAAVVLFWAWLYLKVNIQRRNTQDVRQREMDPIRWVSIFYYVINMFLEFHCLLLVHKLQGALSRTEGLRPTIRRVLRINTISFFDSVAMVAVHVELVQRFLSKYVLESWHSWTMGALFFIRYLTVSLLIEPVSECDRGDRESEISSALHFGPLLSYEFERGSALVICNSRYQNDSGQCQLRNQVDGHRYAAALECIGFEVGSIQSDLTSTELMRCFEQWASRAIADKADGIAFAYSGHGDVDTILGVDGEQVFIPDLIRVCWNGEPLVPKLFFFDCCRGDSTETRRPRRNELSFKVLLKCNPRGPSAMADCLTCFATPRHFRAYGDEGKFTQSLCQHIQELAEHGEYDIEDALKLAGAEVALKRFSLCKMQCPTYESSLTRRFVIRSARAAGQSSSTLTSTTASRAELARASSSSSTALLSDP